MKPSIPSTKDLDKARKKAAKEAAASTARARSHKVAVTLIGRKATIPLPVRADDD